jgi:hypothetical protein
MPPHRCNLFGYGMIYDTVSMFFVSCSLCCYWFSSSCHLNTALVRKIQTSNHTVKISFRQKMNLLLNIQNVKIYIKKINKNKKAIIIYCLMGRMVWGSNPCGHKILCTPS